MAIKIVRKYYETIRSTFASLARKWNGINSVIRLNGQSPAWSGNQSGGKHKKTIMNEKIPVNLRKTINKNYSGETNEINQTISEETSRIHTLGNENYIRTSVKNLNNITQNQIGKVEGLSYKDISNKGHKISTNLSLLKLKSDNKDLLDMFDSDNGVKKFSELSNNSNDNNYLSKPYQTSYIQDGSSDVLTFNVNENYALNDTETVKYSDYEEINTILSKINVCLSKRNSWFDSNGRCQLSCQVNCQHTCQISCQGCNTKQCHNQKCGSI